jgi:hypothetical protein
MASDRITILTQTPNAGQLLSNRNQVLSAVQGIAQLKKEMDSIAGFPADYAALATAYGVDETQAAAMLNTVTGANVALSALAVQQYTTNIGL